MASATRTPGNRTSAVSEHSTYIEFRPTVVSGGEIRHSTAVPPDRTFEVTERGELVARLVPIPRTGTIIDQLVAAGRVTPPTASWHELPGSAEDGINVADELAATHEQQRY